jgi:uncharacterized RDD family membrane protein YckC
VASASDNDWWRFRLIPAGVPLRATAFVVDGGLILSLITAYFWFFSDFASVAGQYFDPELAPLLEPGEFSGAVTKIVGLSILAGLVYSVACEGSPWMGTIGKRLVGIRVVDEYGERLTLTTAIIRNLLKGLSIGCLGLGVVPAVTSPFGQAWHDRLARTFVAWG